MSTEKTDALVIRLTDFSESSRVVTLFTREFGRISALAKGGRRLKGPFDGGLDLLAACRIVFIRKSTASLDLLTEAQLLRRYQPEGRDLVRYYGGFYVAELLNGLTEEYDPHPRLYDQALATLDRLAAAPEPRLAVLRFELVLLREIGQLPALEGCVVCGEPVNTETTYALWVSQGGLICRTCQREEYHARPIPAGTVALLRQLASENETLLDRLQAAPAQLNQLRTLATTAISHVLGKRPRMLRYLERG
ncbi:MAG TPA: DNA repair protein RecO [Planctomycetaceae bacterium]|nr:DNA repair protein RecO [Planctomycetaceae bacterium]